MVCLEVRWSMSKGPGLGREEDEEGQGPKYLRRMLLDCTEGTFRAEGRRGPAPPF